MSIDTIITAAEEAVLTDEINLNGKLGTKLSLTDGVVTPNKTKNQRGRPAVHPFAGRINFRIHEREMVLNDTEGFKRLMEESHSMTSDREDTLVSRELMVNTGELNYTLKGTIEQVINQARTLKTQWESEGATVAYDFHKVRVITNKQDENYIEDVTSPAPDGKKVIEQIECYPNMLYAYLTVTFPT